MPNQPEHDERYEQRTHQLGVEDMPRLLQTMAAILGETMPDGFGFALFLIPHGERTAAEGGGVAYISDCERQGIADGLELWIEESRKRGLIKAKAGA